MTDLQIDTGIERGLFILSGPTSGLGRSIYDLLVTKGADVLAIGRGTDRLERGGMAIEADFAEVEAGIWLAAVEAQLEHRLAAPCSKSLIFLNNAGTIAPICPASAIEADALRRAMLVNFTSPYLLAARLVELTARHGRALRIVNVTTGAAKRPIAGWLAYCTSKAACRMAFDVLAAENSHVELFHVDPGVIDTGMQAYIREQVLPTQGISPAPATLRAPADVANEVVAKALEGLA